MWAILSLFVIHLAVSACGKQILFGGRQPLSSEEYEEKHFKEILQEANLECNKRSNDLFWYRTGAVLDATKQVVQGINYEFKIRQHPTDCKKNRVIIKGSTPNETMCMVKLTPTSQICSVSVLHRPWLERKIEVTLHGVWRVDSESIRTGEVLTKVQMHEPQWEQIRTILEQAIRQYNVHNATDKLYKLVETDFSLEKEMLNGSTSLTVKLDRTNCPKARNAIENFNSKDDECFSEIVGHSIKCRLSLDDSDLEDIKFQECSEGGIKLRGMWRQSKPKDETKQKCGLSDELMDGTTVSRHQMQNLVRLNVHSMSKDEQDDPNFKNAVKLAVMKYNKEMLKKNQIQMMHKYFEVKHPKLQMYPNAAYEFQLVIQPTNCSMHTDYLNDPSLFEKTCASFKNGAFQKCSINVPLKVAGAKEVPLISVSECRSTPRRSTKMVGAPTYVKKEEHLNDPTKSLLNRIADHYTSLNDTLHVYKVVEANDVHRQVVAGESYKMKVTLKAVSFKNGSKVGLNQTTVVCQAKVLRQPWKKLEIINVTECWHFTEVANRVEGEWIPLSTEESSAISRTIQGNLPNTILANAQDLVFDYLENLQKLKVADKEVYLSDLHLKNKSDGEKNFKCKVITTNEFKASRVYKSHAFACVLKPLTAVEPGNVAPMDADELQSLKMQQILEHITTLYTQQFPHKMFHRFLGFKNATKQEDDPRKISAFAYLQETKCDTKVDEMFYRYGEHLLCDSSNSLSVKLCQITITRGQGDEVKQIDVGKCVEVDSKSVSPIQPGRSELHHTSTFADIEHGVALVFNSYWHEANLYAIHQVDHVTNKKESGKINYQFDVYLRPTNCAKWGEMPLLGSGMDELCTNKSQSLDVIKCKCNVFLSNKEYEMEKIILENCNKITSEVAQPLRPMSSKKIEEPKFRNLVDKTMTLLNNNTYSNNWITFLGLENPKIGYLAGKLYMFNLHAVSSECREVKDNTSSKTCNAEKEKFLLNCKVRIWKQGWSEHREYIDIKSCSWLPIRSTVISPTSIETPIDHEECVKHILPKYLEILREQNNVTEPLTDPMIDNIVEHKLPGKKLTFELYLKPKISEDDDCNNGAQKCNKDYFYSCKASFWHRPWANADEYNLKDCMKIHPPPKTPTQADLYNLLQQFKIKAMRLFNDELAKKFVYEPAEVNNPKFMTDYGTKITFELVMKPRDCLGKDGEKTCNADQSKLRAQCLVIAKRQPWLPDGETIHLRNCLETYARHWTDDGGELSEEEQESDGFKNALNALAKLYKPSIPIQYALGKVRGSVVHKQDNWRNISLEMFLQPVGCDETHSNTQDKGCVGYSKQDEVLCQAVIAENMKNPGLKHLQLNNCQQLWKSSAKRPIEEEERSSSWFRDTLDIAWKIQTGIPEEKNLYAITQLDDAEIETTSDRVITYTMNLVETECKRNKDEDKFSNGSAVDCPFLQNPKMKSCHVVYTLKPDGKYHTQVSCSFETLEPGENSMAD